MRTARSALLTPLFAVAFVATIQGVEGQQQRQRSPQTEDNARVAPNRNTNMSTAPGQSAPSDTTVTSGDTDCAEADFDLGQAQTMTAIALAESGGTTGACKK